MYDGEAVIFRDVGHTDFRALLSRHGPQGNPYGALRHALIQRADFKPLPLQSRRARLESAVEQARPYLTAIEAIEGDGPTGFVTLAGSESKAWSAIGWGTAYQSGRCGCHNCNAGKWSTSGLGRGGLAAAVNVTLAVSARASLTTIAGSPNLGASTGFLLCAGYAAGKQCSRR